MSNERTMKNAHATYTSLSTQLVQIERTGDIRRLRALLASDSFAQSLLRMDAGRRQYLLIASGRMLARMQAEIGPLIRHTKVYGAPNKPKWDAAMIAKLRAADAKYGNDEDNARALGVTEPAARRARLRYIGVRGTGVTGPLPAQQAA